MTLFSEELFDLAASRLGDAMRERYPWEILAELDKIITTLGEALPGRAYRRIGKEVWVARDAYISREACIVGPCIIGAGTEIRRGAYIRGTALIGDGCVIGNATEIKNAVLFDRVTAPHFNYIGDAVLGRGVHLGAGVILSNLRGDRREVVVRACPPIATGRRKLGAMVGDACEIGCNAVLNPGVVLGRGCRVYPLTSVSGVWKADSVVRAGV